jgi:hypothetical protein
MKLPYLSALGLFALTVSAHSESVVASSADGESTIAASDIPLSSDSAAVSIISTDSGTPIAVADGSPQYATTTESDPEKATGSPGRIPEGNPPEPVNFYPNTGKLTRPEPMPYMPAGGVNTSPDDIPVYQAFSDFDWHSLSLTLYQEWIELDLFQEGLRRFTVEEFEAVNITADDRSLIEFMAQQEVGEFPYSSSQSSHPESSNPE